MDQEIGEIYDQISGQISPEEFEVRVEEKVSLMGELCDRRTAAMLVAREFGEMELKIDRIRPETGKVTFLGKVLSLSMVHEFPRSDGSFGRVANLSIGDETGTVRIVLWDDLVEPVAKGEITVGETFRVRGFTREGYFGTEVTVDRGGLEEVEADIETRVQPHKISEIRADMGEITIIAQVIDPGEIRQFVRRDGTAGLVRSVTLGDDTGKIRLTLWNEMAEMEIEAGDTLEVGNALSRERYGQVEIQAGGYSTVRKSEVAVDYQEKITPVSEVEAGSTYSISGFVTGLGDVREFQRDDGTIGRVANIYVSDDTGRVRVALWNDHVNLIEKIDLGSRIDISDCLARSGWNGELELSCGWRSRVTFAPPE
ncbi:OB-fold nucleic acid binding domain-containing protein [Candidatus Methanocrinis natronophilus]|uniref:OB-fold nucleic acid binding domain-containing protein n=1 Tax=Candidatus Methanocrinis natronophilus TaxID=3033396 RepID=A0ABT5X649_9EURY|nr:OB-fold nucleic acid binding domain-containing protein [Candidatus Methanocrinis natronophilus]MDF0590169.1 OB-fold nucleic acid binding domain-containing protein [Candidatus Methanocrinis natronophilus]